MKNRALRILKLADRFLEKHGVMSVRDWNEIILKVEKENFEKSQGKVGETKNDY